MEICSMQDNGEIKNLNNAQRHSSRPLSNDWHYFRPTLVFAGHYLWENLGIKTLKVVSREN
jgi:hypothetical protein